ncbi:MAG: DNA repair protein RecO [Gammaproteobacteria bacterium]|nr:DNA repair protein RecO [Gammaproteobacteria bacterium]
MTSPTPKRVQLQPAYVLHTRPYRDSSRIADFLTADYGRMTLVARGARGSRSAAFKSGLQPFTSVLISWVGSGEMPCLTELEVHALPLLLSTPRAIQGLYLNELLTRLLARGEPVEKVFSDYQKAIYGLKIEQETQRILRLFEKDLLQELGYGVILEVEGQSGLPVVADQWYRYELEFGPKKVSDARVREDILGASLLSFARQELADTQSLLDAKRLMRRLLTPHLGSRPLHSRQLAKALLQFSSENVSRGPSQAACMETLD